MNSNLPSDMPQDVGPVFGLYRGTSFIPSRLIEYASNSPYSHVAMYDCIWQLYGRWKDEIYESWPKHGEGVDWRPSWGAEHEKGTIVDLYAYKPEFMPLMENRIASIAWLKAQQGKAYDWKGVFSFVLRWGHNKNAWFCSEAALQWSIEMKSRLSNKKPYNAYPGDIADSTLLYQFGSIKT